LVASSAMTMLAGTPVSDAKPEITAKDSLNKSPIAPWLC
jgi:hypothetical protein